MGNNVKQDMTDSATAFESLIWPVVLPWVGGGNLLQMENISDSKFASILDMKAGIDGWQIHSDGMRGIASRIQQGDKAWNTFTVRMARDSGAKTEYEKRTIAIETGKYIYPYLTIQAYIRTWEGPILSIGLAKTVDIISFIACGLHTLRRTSNAEFAVCPWDDMNDNKYHVKYQIF
jgi:hypothetical protein